LLHRIAASGLRDLPYPARGGSNVDVPSAPAFCAHYAFLVDEGNPISFRILERGTAVWSSDDQEIGTVDGVLATDREDIFDGIVIRTAAGRRFVDAPEVKRIAERRVTLAITAAEAEQLPEPDRAAPEFKANPKAGRLARMFGGGWRRR
jgi:hypothetical protein